MITEVYDAFLAGGAPEAKARKAAEALSSENLSTKGDIVKTEGQLAREIAAVEERLNHKIDGLKRDIAKLHRDMAVMKALLLIIIAAQVIPLLKALAVI